jgi:hypothetical protein
VLENLRAKAKMGEKIQRLSGDDLEENLPKISEHNANQRLQ